MVKIINKIARVFYRDADFYVGGKENPYLKRWFLIPNNKYFNIYLHQFLRDDDDRAMHDHPWPSLSILVKGKYIEHTPSKISNSIYATATRPFKAGSFIYRKATYVHRIELLKYHPPLTKEEKRVLEKDGFCGAVCMKIPKPTWTIFITGPKVREWGFHCPKGWRHWRDFCDSRDSGKTGRGCE